MRSCPEELTGPRARQLVLLSLAHLPHGYANHLQPLAQASRVARVLGIRPVAWHGDEPHGIRLTATRLRWRPLALVEMLVRGLLVRQRFDAIITFTPVPYGVLGAIVAKLRRKPLHVGVIGRGILGQLDSRWGWLPRWVLSRATTISVPGRDLSRALSQRGVDGEKVHQLPHGVSPTYVPDPAAPRSWDAVFLGDLLPVKRVDFIVRAWAALVERAGAARLAIVGDGPERRALERLVDASGLSEHVELLGYRRDAWWILQRARVLVMASRSEGLPFALVEAMACGVVPVVGDVGSIGELLQDGINGRLLPTGASEQAYAEALAQTLGDEAELSRMAAAAVGSVEHLRYPLVTSAWEGILDALAR